MVSPRASSAHGGIRRNLSAEPEIPEMAGHMLGLLTHEARDLRPEGAPATGGDPRWQGGRSARRGRAPGLPLHPRGVRAEQPGNGVGCRPRRPRPSRREGPRRQTGARPTAPFPPVPPDPLRSRKRLGRGRGPGTTDRGAGGGDPVAGGRRVARLRAEGGRGARPGGSRRRGGGRPRPRVRLHARERLGREGRVRRSPGDLRRGPALDRPLRGHDRRPRPADRCSCRPRSRARRWRKGT